MVLYTKEQLEKMTLRNLKTAKKHFYSCTRAMGLAATPDQIAYIQRLKAEIIFRRA